LQRVYLEAAERAITPPTPPANAPPSARAAAEAARTSDARALLRGELVELQRLAQAAASRTNDGMTRLHLRDINLEIQRILDPTP
ncbi:MAG: hypothetical protein ACRELT_08080, partial [Longimicrobiales bacterium]